MNITNQIENWIKPKSRVLDLGCGEGSILASLQNNKEVKGLGIEIDESNILKCLKKGVNVIEHNIDRGLGNISDNSFDVVLMSQTIQTLNNPRLALKEITRIGEKCIVTIPNFGHWRSRLGLLFKGQMPKTNSLPENWYNTPNIHLCTLKDFELLCNELNIKIEEKRVTNSRGKTSWYITFFPNLLSSLVVYKISN